MSHGKGVKAYLQEEKLQTLPTKRLLNYKKLLYHNTFMSEDWVWDCTCESCMAEKTRHHTLEDQIRMVKKILATREHVVRVKRGVHQ